MIPVERAYGERKEEMVIVAPVEQIPPDEPVHGLTGRSRADIEQTSHVAESGRLNEVNDLYELELAERQARVATLG